MKTNTFETRLDKILESFAKRIENIERGKTYGWGKEKQAIIDLVLNDVIGKPISFDWVKQNTFYDVADNTDEDMQRMYDDATWLVCSVCHHMKNDPECPHQCEITNKRIAEQRAIIKGGNNEAN